MRADGIGCCQLLMGVPQQVFHCHIYKNVLRNDAPKYSHKERADLIVDLEDTNQASELETS